MLKLILLHFGDGRWPKFLHPYIDSTKDCQILIFHKISPIQMTSTNDLYYKCMTHRYSLVIAISEMMTHNEHSLSSSGSLNFEMPNLFRLNQKTENKMKVYIFLFQMIQIQKFNAIYT